MFSKRFVTKMVLVAGLGALAAFAWLSLPSPAGPQAEPPAHADSADPAALSDGMVLAIDRAAGEITISHGPLKNLGMPPMTMAFRVGDRALLEQVASGDKIKFHADIGAAGAFTVARIERVAQ